MRDASLPSLAAEDSGGNFLVSPDVGLMIWTLIVFGVTMLHALRKLAFPRIQEALDKRQQRDRGVDRRGRAHARARPTSCSRSTASG